MIYNLSVTSYNLNIGSIAQSYALQSILNRNKVECELIFYSLTSRRRSITRILREEGPIYILKNIIRYMSSYSNERYDNIIRKRISFMNTYMKLRPLTREQIINMNITDNKVSCRVRSGMESTYEYRRPRDILTRIFYFW